MPRGKRPRDPEPSDLALLLRSLADRAEADPAFAAELLTAAEQSQLAPMDAPTRAADAASGAASGATPGAKARSTSTRGEPAGDQDVLDPFRVLRERGGEELATQLHALDVATLRRIVRHHRLDPARISARWTNRDKLVQLIVSQTQARHRRGHAFERV